MPIGGWAVCVLGDGQCAYWGIGSVPITGLGNPFHAKIEKA